MATVSIIFNRRRTASKTKNGSVELVISQNGKQKIISTGVHLKKHEWKNGMVVGRFDSHELNKIIQSKYQDALAKVNCSNATLTSISMSDKSFLDWLDKEIIERNDITEGTRKHHKSMAKHLRNSGFIITFNDVNQVNILRWDDALRKQLTNLESIRNYHKRLKPYVTKARLLKYIKENPYDGVKLQRGKPADIRYLTEEERTKIEELELDGSIAIVRDMFIFSCYTGLADADLRKITKEDIVTEDGQQFIIDKRQKTGTRYKLMILPKAQEILERYDYNLNIFTNQKCNQYLKAIQAMAGIKTHLTMHVGSHSISSFSLKINDLQNLNL